MSEYSVKLLYSAVDCNTQNVTCDILLKPKTVSSLITHLLEKFKNTYEDYQFVF